MRSFQTPLIKPLKCCLISLLELAVKLSQAGKLQSWAAAEQTNPGSGSHSLDSLRKFGAPYTKDIPPKTNFQNGMAVDKNDVNQK